MACMKKGGFFVFIVACLDIVLVAAALSHGFADTACFASRKAGHQTAHAEDTAYGWYVKVRTDGRQPDMPPEFGFIKNCSAHWIGDPDDKVIYLTFDAGYENGYTPQILNTLKKHDVPAAFFLVAHYITSAPDLVNRMVSEGHLVCNHSMRHKDMATMTNLAAFQAELEDIEAVFYDVTRKKMPKYFRPPEGRFSEMCLDYAQQLGYETFFWSFAYKDWYNDDQPSEKTALDTMILRTHPGMIALLHSTSATNAKVLDEAITQWKAMGYCFDSLDNFKALP